MFSHRRCRRSLALAAAVTAAITMSGCSDSNGKGGDDSSGPVQLQYWDMQWGSPAFMDQIKKNVSQFNKEHPDIQVKFTQLGWGDYSQKLLSAVQAGNPPDIGGGDSGIPFNMDAQDQALDISDLYDKWESDGTFDDMPEWAYKKWDYNGKKVGITWQFDQRAIFYRKDLLEKAGIEVPTTWDELLAAVKQLDGNGVDGIAFPGKQGTYDTDQFYMTLVLQAGGYIADKDGKPAFDTPEQLKALNFEKELLQYAPKGTPSWTFTEVLKQFEQQKAAFAFGGGWFVADIEKNAPKLMENVGVLPVLEGPGGPDAAHCVSFANPWMIYKQTDHPEQAKTFLSWMMEKDHLAALYAAEPGAKWPVYKSLLDDPTYQKNELVATLAKQVVESGVDYWYPNNTGAVGIASMGTGITDTIVNPVLAGKTSPEEALADAQERLGQVFITK
jgi:multiple sugar transport system substrate-binding protein